MFAIWRREIFYKLMQTAAMCQTLWWSSFHFLWANFDDIYIILTSLKSADSIYCSEDDYYINLPNSSSNTFYQLQPNITDFHDKIIGLQSSFHLTHFSVVVLISCFVVIQFSWLSAYLCGQDDHYISQRGTRSRWQTHTDTTPPWTCSPVKGKIKHWNFYWQGRYNVTLLTFIAI